MAHDDAKNSAAHHGSGQSSQRRKQKVIIHSSPFLRCLQTSIGISAGLGEYTATSGKHSKRPTPTSQPAVILEESEDDHVSGHQPGSLIDETLPTKLRVDAFLGEWLSPDYFVHITPPPESKFMLAHARAELLRPAEEIRGADIGSSHSGRLSAGWLSDAHTDSGAPMPFRIRAATFATERKPLNRFGLNNGMQREEGGTYGPPIPTYAISPSDPIPQGFVAHARDACVDIDYQWDSMKPPEDWGTGGDYGEEWSKMHRRFRNGLQKLLAYYGNNDEADELVIILVTHQAGCNALIGAITSAPVLLDVGVASLTLAVRKDEHVRRSTSPTRMRRGSIDLGVAEQFDMRIIASTEHLRANANPLGLNSPRLGRSPAFASRKMAGAESFDGFSIGDPLARPASSSPARRTTGESLVPSVIPRSSGLWQSQSSRDGMTDSSGSETSWYAEHRQNGDTNAQAVAQNAHVPARTSTHQGLWGSDDMVNRTDHGTKRRWTASMENP